MSAETVVPAPPPARRTASAAAALAPRARRWAARGARFTAVQSLVYAVNLVSGFLLVNLLAASEYALFTAAFAAFTVAAIVADSGAISAFTALGAEVRDDPARLRGLLGDVMRVRVRLGAAAAAVGVPMLLFSLHRLGYGVGTQAAGALLCLAYVVFSTLQATWAVVLRLKGEWLRMQRVDLVTAVGRLALIVAAVGLLRSGLLALVLSTAVQAWSFLGYRRAGRPFLAGEGAHGEFSARIAGIVRSALPGVVFFAFQGQLTVAILAFVGSRAAVAGAGALMRVAVVYAVLGPLVTNVVAPRFAAERPERALGRYFQAMAGVTLLAAALVGVTMALSTPFLALLGTPYRHLRPELLIVALTAAAGFVAMVAGELAQARAWVLRSWLVAPVVLLTQAAALAFLDVTTLHGALEFGLVGTAAPICVFLYQAVTCGTPMSRRALDGSLT